MACLLPSGVQAGEARVEFRILGPLEVLDGDRPLALPGGRGRALLALLILHAGEVVSTERIIDELWGESPPPTVDKALQGLMSNLRKRFEPPRAAAEAPKILRTAPPGYVLAVEPNRVDAHRFRRLVADASGAPASERSARLRHALSLWRGPALADFTYEPFAQREITVLEELRLAAIEERIEADLELGLHRELVAELEGKVAEHPFRERLRGQLMLALYRNGRQADALAAYRHARTALADELGIEPGPTLQQLEQAVLRQDPTLDRAPSRAREEVDSGSRAAAQPWFPAERRTLTVMFVDLAVSLGTDGTSDPEAVRRVVARATDVAATVLTRHGATVEELVGDVLVGLFGIPTAHEDDILRALRGAAELRAHLTEGGIRLPLRVGIETGEVVVGPPGSGHPRAYGDAVNIATRLQREAGAGEVLVGEAAQKILREAAALEPLERPHTDRTGRGIRGWRFLDLIPGAPAVVRHLDAPMVGRVAELARLHGAFEDAVRRRTAYRFTVLGDPGIGKSRLAMEFAATLDSRTQVLTGHCPAYGDGITFWPLREIVLEAAGPGGRDALVELLAAEDDGEEIAAQVGGAIGWAQEPARPDALFPAFRRLFEVLVGRAPLLLVLEDVHWAEPTLLDLVEFLAGRTSGPLLLLCLARPELIEERPAWGAGGRDADTLFLEPLGSTETEKLIADRLAGRALPAETFTRIAEAAQGNPLFAEQMVAAFQEEGTLSVPASLDVLLAARLDRLGPAERDLLRCAAVAGTEFAVDAVTALVPEPARPFVDRHLQALQQKQLLRPARSTGEGFRFRHVLIQRASYRSMTREDRARLHQRFAEWLQGEARERPPELDEILGFHLESAVEQRRALGMPGERDSELAARAGEHLARAGMRAFDRFDIAATQNLLSRARSLLPGDHPRRRDVMRVLAETYPMMGRHHDADAVLAEMLEEAGAEGDHSLEQTICIERARIRLITGPDPTRLDGIRREAERALEAFTTSGDDARAAQACYVLGLVHERNGAMREMERVTRRGIAHARRSGLLREEAGPLWNAANAVRMGPTPVQEAIRECEELARWRRDMLHPGVLCELAHLRAMAGEFDEARDLVSRARRFIVERLRLRRPLMWAARSSAAVEILTGNQGGAERELRLALEMALAFDERDVVSKIAARLSRCLSARGAPEEAERFATMSFDHAPAESVPAQALWRAAKARVMANRDDDREAEHLAREALRLAPVEMPNLRADLLTNLAEILLARADRGAAMPLITAAIELYERKGNIVSAARARSLVS
jgi:DNA-binding SARP family transcriptional activator